MRSAILSGAVLALLALAPPARGEIYRWTDAEGREHFTSDPSQLPAEARVRALEGDGARGTLNRSEAQAPASPPAAAAPRPGSAPTSEPAAELIGGKDEASWRRGAEGLRRDISRLEEAHEECQGSAKVRLGPGYDRREYEEEKAEADRCNRVANELQGRRLQLERLEENAHSMGVPPGWLR